MRSRFSLRTNIFIPGSVFFFSVAYSWKWFPSEIKKEMKYEIKVYLLYRCIAETKLPKEGAASILSHIVPFDILF